MAFRYLDDDTLDEVRTAAVELGFASEDATAGLVADLPPAFVAATMPGGGNAIARLRGFTAKLNSTRVLVTGEVPLHTWLKAAISMAGGAPQTAAFRRALEVSSADGVASPPGALQPSAPPAPPDVDALPRSASGLEVQIGEDDTLDVAFLHEGAAVSRSVAKLAVHRHFEGQPSMLPGNQPELGRGTGWLVASRLLITNHHVVAARVPLEPAASEQDFALQGQHTEVIFDFFAADSALIRTAATGCVAADRELDFALLRLPEGAPDRPPLRLRTSAMLKPKDRALAERVNVLQYPGHGPMRLAFRNNFVVTGTAERLSYLTDTDGGSSGSPLCDDAWFAAGLHRGFTAIEGGPVQVWGREISQENYGTPVPRIMSHLAEHHPDLHAEILAGQ